MALAPLGLGKTMESNKGKYFFGNKQMEINKQEPLFLDKSTHLHASSDNNNSILEPGYSKSSQCIALYLSTLQKPSCMTAKEYQKFKNYALHF